MHMAELGVSQVGSVLTMLIIANYHCGTLWMSGGKVADAAPSAGLDTRTYPCYRIPYTVEGIPTFKGENLSGGAYSMNASAPESNFRATDFANVLPNGTIPERYLFYCSEIRRKLQGRINTTDIVFCNVPPGTDGSCSSPAGTIERPIDIVTVVDPNNKDYDRPINATVHLCKKGQATCDLACKDGKKENCLSVMPPKIHDSTKGDTGYNLSFQSGASRAHKAVTLVTAISVAAALHSYISSFLGF